MNVGLSTSVIQRGRSGVAQYVFSLLRAFLPYAGRHQFTLYALEEDLPLFAFVEPRMKLAPVPERFRPPVKNILWHQIILPRLARRHRLDVLHVPSYRRMLWARPCARVATIHDLAPFRLAHKYDPKRTFYGRVVARRLAHRQDEIIAVSQETGRDILDFFQLSAERLTMIYNGLDHGRFFPGSREEARAFAGQRLGLHQPFFLYVARLEHPAKNHVRLIEAFNRFKAETRSDWQLVFGGSDWHGAEVIHAFLRQSPFARDIHCLGFVPEAELSNWYRAADVFVYPSLFEGFGLPPIEAMACGCPVISSTRGSLAEVVGDAAALVDPESVNSLKQQMARLASDHSLRAVLREAGLKRAQCFNWDKTAAATLNVYSRAVARWQRTPSV
ncbi:MAG: glycosyltransferase family 1 protein [Verrucomicrobia bacterium]|nr:MAG: glycosyltransferase family 1 protein [Verrucomicrobiota bacterium]